MTRAEALELAESFVNKVIQECGLESYRSGNPFGTGYTVTKAEQKVRLILEVADWLLGKEEI